MMAPDRCSSHAARRRAWDRISREEGRHLEKKQLGVAVQLSGAAGWTAYYRQQFGSQRWKSLLQALGAPVRFAAFVAPPSEEGSSSSLDVQTTPAAEHSDDCVPRSADKTCDREVLVAGAAAPSVETLSNDTLTTPAGRPSSTEASAAAASDDTAESPSLLPATAAVQAHTAAAGSHCSAAPSPMGRAVYLGETAAAATSVALPNSAAACDAPTPEQREGLSDVGADGVCAVAREAGGATERLCSSKGGSVANWKLAKNVRVSGCTYTARLLRQQVIRSARLCSSDLPCSSVFLTEEALAAAAAAGYKKKTWRAAACVAAAKEREEPSETAKNTAAALHFQPDARGSYDEAAAAELTTAAPATSSVEEPKDAEPPLLSSPTQNAAAVPETAEIKGVKEAAADAAAATADAAGATADAASATADAAAATAGGATVTAGGAAATAAAAAAEGELRSQAVEAQCKSETGLPQSLAGVEVALTSAAVSRTASATAATAIARANNDRSQSAREEAASAPPLGDVSSPLEKASPSVSAVGFSGANPEGHQRWELPKKEKQMFVAVPAAAATDSEAGEPCVLGMPLGLREQQRQLWMLQKFQREQIYYLDGASAFAACCLDVAPGDRVLDLCAAPGGKSLILATQLFLSSAAHSPAGLSSSASRAAGSPSLSSSPSSSSSASSSASASSSSSRLLSSSSRLAGLSAAAADSAVVEKREVLLSPRTAGPGFLVCNEASHSRAKRLRDTLLRQLPSELFNRSLIQVTCCSGIIGTSDQHGSVRASFARYSPFDKILVDAPCSSDRHLLHQGSAALSRWSPGVVRANAERQLLLLKTAVHLLKFGGVILYCTCSLAEAENDQVIEKLLRTHKGNSRAGRSSSCLHVLPISAKIWENIGTEATACEKNAATAPVSATDGAAEMPDGRSVAGATPERGVQCVVTIAAKHDSRNQRCGPRERVEINDLSNKKTVGGDRKSSSLNSIASYPSDGNPNRCSNTGTSQNGTDHFISSSSRNSNSIANSSTSSSIRERSQWSSIDSNTCKGLVRLCQQKKISTGQLEELECNSTARACTVKRQDVCATVSDRDNEECPSRNNTGESLWVVEQQKYGCIMLPDTNPCGFGPLYMCKLQKVAPTPST